MKLKTLNYLFTSIFICFLVLLQFSVSAIQDSTKVNTTIESISKDIYPDTLVDLNRQLVKFKSLMVDKGVIIPESIEITSGGLIILTSDEQLKAKSYSFELKAEASHNEVYIISVKIRKSEGKVLVSIVADKIDMATGIRAEGKIYVVIGVMLIVFLGILAFLIYLEKKLNKLEKKANDIDIAKQNN